jgi:Uma2 family endonuclease
VGTLERQRPGTWRFDELDGLPDDGRRYEVVDGLLVVSPPPSYWHQTVSAALLRQLSAQAPPQWRVLHELGLPLGTDGRVPDLSVVSARAPAGPGAPLPGPEHVALVVEVVSPSSRKTDRFAKPGEYAEAGLPLFWRVETEPDLLLLAFRRLTAGTYEQVAVVEDVGDAPAPWGPVRLDLAGIRGLAT